MVNVLGIGLDYLMLKDDKVRGDVRERQFEYARRLKSLTLIVYTPKNLGLKPQKWADNLWIYPTNSKNKATFIFDAYRIASTICKQKKIDVITTEDPFTTGFVGYRLKKKFVIPLNVQVHIDFCDNQYWMNLRRINLFFNKFGKYICKRADTIRCGTTREKMKFMNFGVAENKISVCFENMNLDRFKNVDGNPIRNMYLSNKFKSLILFTGRLVAQKGIPTLLKAFQVLLKKRPSVLLLIVGSGAKEAFLKDFTVKLNIDKNVLFTGSIEHKRIPEYLAACDVYVVASIFEGTCIAMAEAMAVGKPVVATRFAGAEDLVEDGKSGFLVNHKDFRAIAEKIDYLIENPEKSAEMGKRASISIDERFSNNLILEKVISLWEETAKCNGK